MSIHFNSWISNVKISINQFTVILACLSKGLNIKSTLNFTNVSERTIRDYFAIFRSIAKIPFKW